MSWRNCLSEPDLSKQMLSRSAALSQAKSAPQSAKSAVFKPPPVKKALFSGIEIHIPVFAFPSVPEEEIPVPVVQEVSHSSESVTRNFSAEVSQVKENREEEDMEIEEADSVQVSLEERMKRLEEEETEKEKTQAKRVLDTRKLICRRMKRIWLPPANDYREEATISLHPVSGPIQYEDREPGEILEEKKSVPVDQQHAGNRSRSRSPKRISRPSVSVVTMSAEERTRRQQELLRELNALEHTAPRLDLPEDIPVQSTQKQDDLKGIESSLSSADDMFVKTPEPQYLNEQNSGAVSQSPEMLTRAKLDDLDDPEGYYLPQIGEVFYDELRDKKYSVQAILGKGVYSCVVRVLELASQSLFAVKIIRNNPAMIASGHKELKIFERFSELDPLNHKHTVLCYGGFKHQQHLCLVFEDMELNLREVLKKFGQGMGLSLAAIKSYGRQIMFALELFKSAKFLHCDLKPDNILVTKDLRKVKMCDFGSVLSVDEVVQTDLLIARYYRPPEVILGLPLDYSVDMWSIGCTLFELYTGNILFPGSTNGEILKLIMELKGPIHKRLRNKGVFSARYFDTLSFSYSVLEESSGEEKLSSIPLTDIKKVKSIGLLLNAGNESEQESMQEFVSLLEQCLALDPQDRLTPESALQHPFLKR